MKRVLLIATIYLAACGVYAQGRINFANNASPASSLILTNYSFLGGGGGGIAGPSGTYRFELYVAADGSSTFYPTGITNANSSLLGPGRIFNRNSVVLPWWLPWYGVNVDAGSWIQVQVRGWSANIGNATTWDEAMTALSGFNETMWPSCIAISGVGRVQLASSLVNGPTLFAGGPPPPAGTVQISDFQLPLVPLIPEPSTLALVGLGLAGVVLLRRRG
jgi:hypothetical protein